MLNLLSNYSYNHRLASYYIMIKSDMIINLILQTYPVTSQTLYYVVTTFFVESKNRNIMRRMLVMKTFIQWNDHEQCN